MKSTGRFGCFVVLIGSLLASFGLTAHAQELPQNWQGLKLYELERATRELDATARANAFAGWMAVNDWQSMEDMELHDLYNLYSLVNADSVDRRHFSARWTGSLTAPSTGAYTLKQVRQYSGTDSRIKVTIDGQTVLDSTVEPSDESSFVGQPVQLAAGQAAPIQVDMVHNVPSINDFSEGAPMIVLTWQLDESPETIIPASAFSPPAGFAEPGARGLKGEYFGNTDFGDLRSTRLDPALDLIWSWPPAAPIHQQEASAAFNACKARLLDETFLAQAAAENNDTVFSHSMWRIAYRMTATERKQLVEMLVSNPNVLATMTPEAMGRLMQAVYMLPGDEHIELLGEWSLERPQPRCVAGQFPGWGEGYYQERNTDYYWLMGLFMQGPYWNDAETLCDQYLERPDGECNLSIAYTAAFAARANRSGERVMEILDEQIDDQSVVGDSLMTWLVARAFAKGALPTRLQPMGGFSDLESAYVAAESSDHKFWALQEMVARLISVDKGDLAQAFIEERGGQFTSPAQEQAIADWTAKAAALAAVYAQRKTEDAEARQAAYVKELKRRRQRAADRGDSAAVGRYAELISSAESRFAN